MISNDLASASTPQRQSVLPSSDSLKLRFWGVRGSYPVPGAHTVKYGGNTSCVEIRNAAHRLIFDAGTGLIGLGDLIMAEYRRNNNSHHPPLPLTILLSHTHHDHIQALPFFQPAYFNETWLYVFGPQLLGIDLQDSITHLMTPRYCPVRLEELNANKIIKNVADSDRILFRAAANTPEHLNARQELKQLAANDLVVSMMRSYAHPKDGVFCFKIAQNGKRIVYATDTEGYSGGDARLIEFAHGADILIHDAQYTTAEYTDQIFPTQGFGHSTIDMACEVARKAGVGKLILYHHDPHHDDAMIDGLEQYARTLFPETYAAHEGMEITL